MTRAAIEAIKPLRPTVTWYVCQPATLRRYPHIETLAPSNQSWFGIPPGGDPHNVNFGHFRVQFGYDVSLGHSWRDPRIRRRRGGRYQFNAARLDGKIMFIASLEHTDIDDPDASQHEKAQADAKQIDSIIRQRPVDLGKEPWAYGWDGINVSRGHWPDERVKRSLDSLVPVFERADFICPGCALWDPRSRSYDEQIEMRVEQVNQSLAFCKPVYPIIHRLLVANLDGKAAPWKQVKRLIHKLSEMPIAGFVMFFSVPYKLHKREDVPRYYPLYRFVPGLRASIASRQEQAMLRLCDAALNGDMP